MTPRSFVATGLAILALGGLVSTAQAFTPIAFTQDDKPKSDDNPLKPIIEDLQAEKYDAAVSKVEALLKDKPKDMQLLSILLQATQQQAQSMMQNGDRKASIPVFLKSADAAKKLQEVFSKTSKEPNQAQAQFMGMVLYNGACSLAIDGKADEAMAMLKDAIKTGFADADTFAKDEELDSLRKRKDFSTVTKLFEEKKAEVAAKEAEAEKKAAEAEKKEAEAAKAAVPTLFKEHKPFPFSFELPDVNDKKVKLDDYKGKVVIVDIWGTWCPPCRKEIPHFIDLLKEYKEKGLEIVGINYEEGEPDEVKKVIKEFVAENKMPYTCVIGDEKTQKLVPEFEGYPTTLFIDRTGKVRLKVVGYQYKEVLDEIIKTLVNEK